MRRTLYGWVAGLGLLMSLAAQGCESTQESPGEGNESVGSAAGGKRKGSRDSLGAGQNSAGSSTGVAGNPSGSGQGGSLARGDAGTGGDRARGNAGAAGQGGTASTPIEGGAPDANPAPTRGPTPPTKTAKFPFPQNRESPHCIYPTGYRNEVVRAVYDQWKADLVTSEGASSFLRVKRPREPGLEVNSTVSEGIAYGMMVAVYMDDQPLFDGLWKYEQLYLDACGLMHWYILANGTIGSNPDGHGAATDADEDMAWALVMADRQWGGKGTLEKSYLEYAKDQIEKIWKCEILDGKLPRPGDGGNGQGFGGWSHLNISYFAPAYYRVFAKVSGNAAWADAVVKTVYDTIDNNVVAANKNQDNGLVPAWSTSDGAASNSIFKYQYDSCRTPFRIGLDVCWNGDAEPRAAVYVGKTSSFFSAIGAANIADGYQLDGTPAPENPGKLSASFVGPAGVGAMSSPSYRAFVDDVYGLLAANNMTCGGLYYDESWNLMSLLMMTGNFLDYTQY